MANWPRVMRQACTYGQPSHHLSIVAVYGGGAAEKSLVPHAVPSMAIVPGYQAEIA